MLNIDKLIEVAEKYKIATLKAREQDILGYREYEDSFHISHRQNFRYKRLLENREYQVFDRGDTEYKYEYKFKINGLNFFFITEELIYEEDENKIIQEVI